MAYDEREITGAWDYASLPANVVVGNDCWIERKDSFAKFRSEEPRGVVLGERTRVFTWTAFNIEPTGVVEVGEDCELVGPVFMCAERITLGRRVRVSYNVTISDSDFHPTDPDARQHDAIANSPQGNRNHRPDYVSRPVTIGDDVSIGIGAMILKGVAIGVGAIVEAGAVVTRDVAPGARVSGNPARPVIDTEQSRV